MYVEAVSRTVLQLKQNEPHHGPQQEMQLALWLFKQYKATSSPSKRLSRMQDSVYTAAPPGGKTGMHEKWYTRIISPKPATRGEINAKAAAHSYMVDRLDAR